MKKQRLGFNAATLSVPGSKGILAGKQRLCNKFTTARHVEDLIERRSKDVYVRLRISLNGAAPEKDGGGGMKRC